MSSDLSLPLTGWTDFYVIVGGASAALTGLQFVVITLAAERHTVTLAGARAFATPTIFHYCAALFVSAVFAAPWHRLAFPALATVLCGLTGLAHIAVAFRNARRQRDYTPVLEDWIWHFALPFLTYAVLTAAGFGFASGSTVASFGIAMLQIVLVFIGIHNAWDSALYIATDGPSARPSGPPKSS